MSFTCVHILPTQAHTEICTLTGMKRSSFLFTVMCYSSVMNVPRFIRTVSSNGGCLGCIQLLIIHWNIKYSGIALIFLMLTTVSLKWFPRSEVAGSKECNCAVLPYSVRLAQFLHPASNVWVLAYQGLVTRILSYFLGFLAHLKRERVFCCNFNFISLTISEIGCMFTYLKPLHSFF